MQSSSLERWCHGEGAGGVDSRREWVSKVCERELLDLLRAVEVRSELGLSDVSLTFELAEENDGRS